jgi:outer membrane cobalamin receptor
MISRILTGAFLTLCTLVHAQDEEQIDTLKIDKLLNLSFEDLVNVSVVTPTLNAQKSGEVPATVIVITQDQIQLRGYQNLAGILNDLPDFTISDKSDPQFYNRMSARGVSRQDLFVILMDGVRISSPTNEPLPILENFPIYLAKQIEVVYGPGSALYAVRRRCNGRRYQYNHTEAGRQNYFRDR